MTISMVRTKMSEDSGAPCARPLWICTASASTCPSRACIVLCAQSLQIIATVCKEAPCSFSALMAALCLTWSNVFSRSIWAM